MPKNAHHIAAAALLEIMFLVAGGAALHESATVDEGAHIGAGLSYWQRLEMRLNEEHPPLGKALAALPLALRNARRLLLIRAETRGRGRGQQAFQLQLARGTEHQVGLEEVGAWLIEQSRPVLGQRMVREVLLEQKLKHNGSRGLRPLPILVWNCPHNVHLS
jgi:hypothetical protein